MSLIPSNLLHLKEKMSRCSHVIPDEVPPSARDITRFVLLYYLTSHSLGSFCPCCHRAEMLLVLQAGMPHSMSQFDFNSSLHKSVPRRAVSSNIQQQISSTAHSPSFRKSFYLMVCPGPEWTKELYVYFSSAHVNDACFKKPPRG